MYGSSRLGLWAPNVNLASNNALAVWDTTGGKQFELSNHLGNVLSTVTEKRLLHSTNGTSIDYYLADVATAQDYYPFGMLQPGRQYTFAANGVYRYGFNDKENDNEVNGVGEQQDYGERIYDPRVGRFPTVDPLDSSYPWNSSYAFSEDDPISSVDLDGLEKHHIGRDISTGIKQAVDQNVQGIKGIFSRKTYSELKSLAKDYVGTVAGDPNAAKSFGKKVSKFGIGVSNVANAPGQFIVGIPNRSVDENIRLGSYYVTQFGLMYTTEEFSEMMEAPSLSLLIQLKMV